MKYVLLFCLVFLFSCAEKNQYKDAKRFTMEDFPEVVSVTGKEVVFEEELYMPMRIYLLDSVLVLLNRNMESHLTRYNIYTKKKIGEDISFGSGPEEMLNPESVQLLDSVVWIYDTGKRRASRYLRKDFGLSSALKPDSSIVFEEALDKISFLNEREIVATVLSPEHKRLSFFNQEGLIKTVGEFPSIPNEVTAIEAIETFLGDLAVNPQNGKICLSYRRTDLIEFYDSTGRLEKRLYGPDHFLPFLKQRTIGEGIGYRSIPGETRDAYFFPVQIRDQVALLYSGQTFDLDKRMYYLNQIFFFDWDGKPLKKYILDIPIFHFTIDEQSNRLYGITDDPEFRIIEFQL